MKRAIRPRVIIWPRGLIDSCKHYGISTNVNTLTPVDLGYCFTSLSKQVICTRSHGNHAYNKEQGPHPREWSRSRNPDRNLFRYTLVVS